MKKVWLCTLVCVVLYATQIPVFAQNVKVGYVNLDRIYESYLPNKNAEQKLRNDIKQFENQREGMIKNIDGRSSEMKKLSGDDKERAMQEISDLKFALSSFEKEGRQKIADDREANIKSTQEEMKKVISNFAKAKGYDVIINDKILVYTNNAQDVTDLILQTLN